MISEEAFHSRNDWAGVGCTMKKNNKSHSLESLIRWELDLSHTYPEYGNDTLLSLESWSSPDVAVEIFLQHFGLMALLGPWWNLESLA